MTRENHVRVLLDSVSFSRIICQPLAWCLALTAQLVYCALRFLSSTFLNFFSEKFVGGYLLIILETGLLTSESADLL